MHKKLLLGGLIFIMMISQGISQTHLLSGFVHHGESQDPIAEANVYLTSTNCGTVTDTDGYFRLECPETNLRDSLKVEYLGYHAYVIALNDYQNKSVIYLNPKSLDLQNGVTVHGEKIDFLKHDLPHVSSMVDFKEIEQYGTSEIADIFKPMAAVRVEGNDLDGRVIQIRGSDPEEVNVYVDGILINNLQMNSAADLSLIPVESIDNIEIAKNGNLATLGGGAFGGVVNISTRKNTEERLFLKGKLGNFESQFLIGKVHVPVTRKIHLNYFAQFNQFSPEIEYFPGERYSTKSPNTDIRTQKQNHYLSLYYFTKASELGMSLLGYFLKYRKPNWNSRYHNYLGAMSYKGKIWGMKDFDINLSYIVSDSEINRQSPNSVNYISQFFSNRLNFRFAKLFGNQEKNFQVYLEYYHDELTSHNKIKSDILVNHIYHSEVYDNRASGAAVFSFSDGIEEKKKMIWRFYVGSRVDVLANGDNDITNMFGIQIDYKKSDLTVSPLFNYGQNVRYPSLLENAFYKDVSAGNTGNTTYRLQPEYSTSGDMGVRVNYNPPISMVNQIDADVSVFSRNVYNKILRRPYDDFIAQIPSERIDTKGFEGNLSFKEIFNRFEINTGYLKLNLRDSVQYSYKPESRASVQFQYYTDWGLTFSTTYFYEGKSTLWYYDENNDIQTEFIEPYTDMDISTALTLMWAKLRLRFQFSGYNIFDNSGYRFYYLKKRNFQLAVSVGY